MIIGVPKEIKNNENRVALTPGGVLEMIKNGHKVFVQSTAGLGSGITDDDYIHAGATMLPDIKSVYEKAEMIIKVKVCHMKKIIRLFIIIIIIKNFLNRRI